MTAESTMVEYEKMTTKAGDVDLLPVPVAVSNGHLSKKPANIYKNLVLPETRVGIARIYLHSNFHDEL